MRRLWALLRLLRHPVRLYGWPAYVCGALLPGRRRGTGPVAWPRGWPMPDIRPGAGRIELGHVGLYPGVRLHCSGTGRITVGDGTFLNRKARIFAVDSVTLGRDCMVAWDAVITDCAGHGEAVSAGPVHIGDGAWIGCRAVVLGGTRLGRGCVVAAGAVVQGKFAAGSLLVGCRAEAVS